ncbi:MAG: betaine/proline/choline family ABC transporter ATP-binding protein [Pseudomonadota bacterium]
MATADEPAIRAEGLWMVFGEDAKRRLATELGTAQGTAPGTTQNDGNRRDAVTETLRGAGLIPAVRDVSFDVGRGELFVIMGLSGSGKSTVIRCVSRLLEPSSGRVAIQGEDILSAKNRRLIELRRSRIGMVFQHFGLFPHMTVADNVAFPLRVQGTRSGERRSRAEDVIRLVGLEGREDSYPRELSGGQRQRVGIARSLVMNPDIWFLDEPFSALDPLIRRQLQDEFLSLQAELNKSIVFITHDIAEALKLADRIAIMRDGVIVQVGTPAEIVLNPVDAYVAEFASEVPKGRLMKVEAMMRPMNGAALPEGGPVLAPAMSLEDALTRFVSSAGAAPLAVQDGDGKTVGVVTPEALVKAMGEARDGAG